MMQTVYDELEEIDFLESNPECLSHHGRLGQKWGRRNGPPYPLDYNKLSSKERELAKEDAIRRGDVKEASFNRQYYTDDELNKVINRFNLNAKLTDISTDKIPTTWDKMADIGKKMGTVATTVQNGTNLYNNVAKVVNAVSGSELPIVGESKKKDTSNKTIIEDYNSKGELIKKTTTSSKNGDRYTKNEVFDPDLKETLKAEKKEKKAQRAAQEGSWQDIANTLKESRQEMRQQDLKTYEDTIDELNQILFKRNNDMLNGKR